GHRDNVAPAVLGSAVLAVVAPSDATTADITTRRLSVSDDIAFVFAVPSFGFETSYARSLLPDTIAHTDARLAAALSVALVQGLATGDAKLLALGFDDVLHVPYRRAHIKGYENVT